jgi:hypothetical protein
MNAHRRNLMGATALLYLGPLLAGLGGSGWFVTPLFLLVFMMWLLILPPHAYSQSPFGAPASIQMFNQTLIQLLIISICFGFGRGMGGVAGMNVQFHWLLPLLISFLSVPLLSWLNRGAVGMVQNTSGSVEDLKMRSQSESQIALAHRLLDALQEQSIALNDSDLSRHLDAIKAQVDRETLLSALKMRGELGQLLWRAQTMLTVQYSHG